MLLVDYYSKPTKGARLLRMIISSWMSVALFGDTSAADNRQARLEKQARVRSRVQQWAAEQAQR